MRNLSIKTSFRPLFRSVAVIAAVTAFAACSDDITAPDNQAAGGSYELVTVNGADVPYTYTSGTSTISITSDVYVLNNDGTYNETITETVTNGTGSSSPATDTESGTWAQNGSAVVFVPTASTQGNTTQYTASLKSGGTFSHSSLTFSSDGIVWVYDHS
jgi:hypothetical protein